MKLTDHDWFFKIDSGLLTLSTFCNTTQQGITVTEFCVSDHISADRKQWIPIVNPLLCLSSPQISEIYVSGESGDLTAKEKLLLWSQQATEGYPGLRCVNFTSSWSNGRMFNALLHRYRSEEQQTTVSTFLVVSGFEVWIQNGFTVFSQ